MTPELTRPDAIKLLDALRSGSAPAKLARHLFVGQRAWFDKALLLMDLVAECEHFNVRFVRARYGGGKTHFIRCLESDAKDRNWVTAYVLLKKGEVELDKFHTVVKETAVKMQLPDGRRGLYELLTTALKGIARDHGYTQDGNVTVKIREEACQGAGDFCQRNGLGLHFTLALQMTMKGLLENDSPLVRQFANWLGGGTDTIIVSPQDIPGSSESCAAATRIKPLGAGDGEQLIRLLALLVRKAGYKGLLLAIDEIELIIRQAGNARENSFQTLRSFVDQNDEDLLPPATCLFLAATPEMFENPEMFPSYKALQDRIEALPSLTGGQKINFNAPVVNLDATELGKKDLKSLAEKITAVFCQTGEEVPDDLDTKTDAVIDAIAKNTYVIARPRLLCRCMVDLLEGTLGVDLSQEVAARTLEMQTAREREVKGQ